MAITYSRWTEAESSDSFVAQVYTTPGTAIGAAEQLVFYFPDASYIDVLPTEISNMFLVAGGFKIIAIGYPTLVSETTGSGHSIYYNAAGETQSFTLTVKADGLYHYAYTNGGDTESQYVVYIPAIETAIAALAKTLVNTQCSCKMNRSVLDNFVKAKALQQLIYAKVDDLGTTYNATSLLGVNTDIKVLSDFLAGTNSACGC